MVVVYICMYVYIHDVCVDMPLLEYLPARTIMELRVTADYLIAQSSGGTHTESA